MPQCGFVWLADLLRSGFSEPLVYLQACANPMFGVLGTLRMQTRCHL